MCKPSCCNNSPEGAGGTAIAVLAIAIIAVIISSKAGPAISAFGRVLMDVVKVASIATGAAVIAAVIIWAVLWYARDRPQPKQARHAPATRLEHYVPVSEQSCLACGDKGTIVRVLGDRALLVRPCPECQPAQQAR